MKRASWALVVATMLAMLQLPTAHAGGVDPTYYLALGDSLSVGFQPNRGPTVHGYTDVLARRLRTSAIADLELENVGCPGETTRSLVSGERSPCSYAAGAQLQTAVDFLTAHPGQVAFVTIDIGVNDLLNRCLEPSLLIQRSCAREVAPKIGDRLAQIVDALSSAAGPGVPIVGMTYYNPFLGLWGLVPGGRHLARADQRAWQVFNDELVTGLDDAGAYMADVASTFRIDDFDETVVVAGRGPLPVNVALACRWTWFCSDRYLTDPHADRTGYRRIAGTFESVLGPVLRS